MTQSTIKTICVFGGARTGARPAYVEAARALGATLANDGLQIVFGGGSIGMMGAMADAALAAGGKVIGVIPHGLAAREIAHGGVTELIRVDSMHQRKALMEVRSDAFIAMPGGFGTFEELFEMITWLQLGLHRKPIGVLNVQGFWDPVLAQIDRAITEGFIPETLRQAVVVADEPAALVQKVRSHSPPLPTVRWLSRDET